jgi:HAD superfamily hydrolase (TIGR01509 family)
VGFLMMGRIFLLRAVIFDMDGVIVDSEPAHVKSERQLFAPYGISLSDEELQSYMGRSSWFLLEDIIRKYGIDAKAERLYPEHKKNLLQLYREEVEPIPGALELIGDLKNRGVDLALASSSDRDLVLSIVEKFQLTSTFCVLVSGDEVQRVKPHPDIFLKALERLGRSPRESIVIEDSQAGVQASNSAGIICVGFRSPHSQTQDLSEASMVVDDLCTVNYRLLNKLIDGSA